MLGVPCSKLAYHLYFVMLGVPCSKLAYHLYFYARCAVFEACLSFIFFIISKCYHHSASYFYKPSHPPTFRKNASIYNRIYCTILIYCYYVRTHIIYIYKFSNNKQASNTEHLAFKTLQQHDVSLVSQNNYLTNLRGAIYYKLWFALVIICYY